MSAACAAAAALRSSLSSCSLGSVCPGCQNEFVIAAVKPAAVASAMCCSARVAIGLPDEVLPDPHLDRPVVPESRDAEGDGPGGDGGRPEPQKSPFPHSGTRLPSTEHGQSARAEAEAPPGQAGRLPLPRLGGEDPLRRQGEVAASESPELLPAERRHTQRDRGDGGPDRRPRGDRHRQRGRGAPSRAEPRQAAPAAVQRAAAGRQVVSVHRGHRRRRVPAGDVHAGAPPARRRVLRPLREREEGAGDARRPQPRLPVPPLRGPEAGAPLGHPLSRLPHRPLLRARASTTSRRTTTGR